MDFMPKLKEILPKTAQRVSSHTRPSVNRTIHQAMERRVRYYVDHPWEIDQRLEALDREWDVERVLEANAATLALVGVGLSVRDRRFLVLPAVVTGFLLQHALQGWCPPVPLLRRLGVRTEREIQAERRSLKALAGAFADLEPVTPEAPFRKEKRVEKTLEVAEG